MGGKEINFAIPVKFNIGDKAWKRDKSICNTEDIICEACGGEGVIRLKNKKVYECPECRGRKCTPAGRRVVGFTANEVEITGVFVGRLQMGADSIGMRKSGHYDSIEYDYKCVGQGHKRESGYCSESSLFNTKEEAEAL